MLGLQNASRLSRSLQLTAATSQLVLRALADSSYHFVCVAPCHACLLALLLLLTQRAALWQNLWPHVGTMW
jgi:hypothetical protein